MNLRHELTQEAKTKDLCNDGLEKLRTMNLEDLKEFYFTGSDWSLGNDFPSMGILKNFPSEARHAGFVFDETKTLRLSSGHHRIPVFNSKIEIYLSLFATAEIIARHNAEVKVYASDESLVFIDVLDNTRLEVDLSDNAKATVYHTDTAQVHAPKAKLISKKWIK